MSSIMAAEAARRAIHRAVSEGDTEGVARMLDEEPRLLSSRNWIGETLLMQAAFRGHVGAVRLLLERGAEVNAVHVGTALHYAAQSGHAEVVSILLSSGADLSREGLRGQTPLMRASTFGRVAVVRVLLWSMGGRGLDKRDEDGRTAVFAACLYGRADVVRTLLLAGADHTIAEDENGRTPQQLAQDSGHYQCVAVIQWWEGELQRAYVLQRARILHDDAATRQQAPAAPVPAYLRPRVQGGSVMPIVEVVAIEQDRQEGEGERGREELEEEVSSLFNVRVEEEDMDAMLKFVVNDLGAELYIELLAGLHR